MSATASDTKPNEAGLYSYASTWHNGATSRISNGYAYAETEAEAKGKAFEVGQKNNPNCSMGGLLVIKIEWSYHDKLEAAMEEIAIMLGLVPEESSIEDIVNLAKQNLQVAPALEE
jgi:hypothetical protein